MQVYRVTHKASGDRYYVLADSEAHAIERVTLHIGDVSGKEAWSASPDAPSYGLSKGVVLDSQGKPTRTMDA
jgi:hypothetical protein